MKEKPKTFTFEVGKKEDPFTAVFSQFQDIAGRGERSSAALIRFLIKKYVDEHTVSEK